VTVVLERIDIEQFRALVEQRLGLFFDDNRLDMLADVLRQRIEALGCDRAAAYILRLEKTVADRLEWRILAERLTVNETYFFRNPDHFQAFRHAMLPVLRAGGPRPLRFLSAGCASGEEPCSLAMLVKEHAPDLQNYVSILGIDINRAVIQKARDGRYSTWALRGTDVETQGKYFKPDGRDFLLAPSVRSMITFEERNLVEDDRTFWRAGSFDIVFCRNVIMYFPHDVARALIARIAGSLNPGGFLFLGHAETLRGISQDFHLCHTHDTFYYQLRGAKDRRDAEYCDPKSTAMQSTPLAPLVESTTSWVDAIQRASQRIDALARGTTRRASSDTAAYQPTAVAPPLPTHANRWDLGMALELLRQERFADAMKLLSSLPDESHADSDVQLLRAALLTNLGDLAGAEKVCAQLLVGDELNAGAHYLTALCREHAGDPAAAMEHDRVAAYLDNAFAMPHLHLALTARRVADLDAARREFENAQVLLRSEDSSRILLFGGGFSREALIELCNAELRALGVSS
jgi:chemotaxis protein methyltransferase CheR